MNPEEVHYDDRGLVPGIVQDADTGRVLMLAFLNAEALDATLRTGAVHFWSRSREALWRKGETSGNTLELVGIEADCDRDALLITARPAGPTCHRGTESCFDSPSRRVRRLLEGSDPPMESRGRHDPPNPPGRPPADRREAGFDPDEEPVGFSFLEELWEVIADRAVRLPEGSYTAELLRGGTDAVGRKVLEEAGEVLLAAKDRAPDRVAEEAADLLYHLLVLLADQDVEPGTVLEELRRRR